MFLLYWSLFAKNSPTPETEYRFRPNRKSAFDCAWPGKKIALEIDGGVYTRGRHTRGTGYEKDCLKYNAAALYGWKLFRFSTHQLERAPSQVIAFMRNILSGCNESAAEVLESLE